MLQCKVMENLQYIYFKDKKTCVTVTDTKKEKSKINKWYRGRIHPNIPRPNLLLRLLVYEIDVCVLSSPEGEYSLSWGLSFCEFAVVFWVGFIFGFFGSSFHLCFPALSWDSNGIPLYVESLVLVSLSYWWFCGVCFRLVSLCSLSVPLSVLFMCLSFALFKFICYPCLVVSYFLFYFVSCWSFL